MRVLGPGQDNANLDMQTMDTLSEEMEAFVRQKGELVAKLISARKEKSKLEQEHQVHAEQFKASFASHRLIGSFGRFGGTGGTDDTRG